MNVNQREVFQHIEFEPNTYYAAFSAELEASAYPMWSMVSHLNDPALVSHTKRVLTSCLTALQDWLDAVNFTHPKTVSLAIYILFNANTYLYL
jgi:E3 ubiquitin-protein ligase UBR3